MEKEGKKESVELEKREERRQLAATSPFGFVRHFAENMERLFEEFEGFRFPSRFPSLLGTEVFPFTKEFEKIDWVPKIEVLQEKEQLIVRAELPGLSKDDVKVEVTDDALTLSGERKEEKEEKREGYYRSERSFGSFYRRVPLPEGAKVNDATATFNNGILEVTMQVPKLVPQKRQLEITQGEKPATAKTAKA